MVKYMTEIDWSKLATNAGALVAVLTLTQLTKDIPGIKAIPTQLWSLILALVILGLATYFTKGFKDLTLKDILTIIINAMMVSLEANGGFEALKSMGTVLKDNVI
jgi:hypothetical protein